MNLGRNSGFWDDWYRYSFQSQECDDEVKGEGNSVNYKHRMHDPRIGRFFAVDPLIVQYPHYSSYSFSGNKVIHAVELEGLEEFVAIKKGNKYILHWDVTARERGEAGTIQILDGTTIIENTRKLLPHELTNPFIKKRINYAVEVVKNQDGSYKVSGEGIYHSEGGTAIDRSKAKTSLNSVFEVVVDVTDLGATKIKPPSPPSLAAPPSGPTTSNIQFDVWTDNISNPTVASTTLNTYAAYLKANPGAS
jgi:hypothetical protein